MLGDEGGDEFAPPIGLNEEVVPFALTDGSARLIISTGCGVEIIVAGVE